MSKKFQNILERIAKENGITPDEVYHEMQIAIDAAFDSPNPEARRNWALIPFKGERPTPEEVVMALANMISHSGTILH